MATTIDSLERAPKQLLFTKIGHLTNKKDKSKLQNSDAFMVLMEDIRTNFSTDQYTENGRVGVLHHLQRMNLADEEILEQSIDLL